MHIYINIHPIYAHWHDPCSDTQSHQHTHMQILNKHIFYGIHMHMHLCSHANTCALVLVLNTVVHRCIDLHMKSEHEKYAYGMVAACLVGDHTEPKMRL